MHGGDDGRMRPALERRCAGDDPLHAGNARSDDRHVRRGHHRIAPARHVAADRVDRDVLVAEHHAGKRLDLQVAHRLLLLLREVSYLRLRELDVVEVALGDLRDGALDLGRRQTEILRLPVVELFRQFADGGILAIVDLRQDAFDRFAHLGIGGFDRARVHSALEPAGHWVSPSCVSRARRSMQRSGMMHRRPGTQVSISRNQTGVPHLRCTAARCTACGTRDVWCAIPDRRFADRPG